MIELVFFLEEASAKAMLEGFLPTLLPPEIKPRFVVFEGKQDLLKQLGRKLKAWQNPHTLFLVLQDKDSGDCVELKNRLRQICLEADKPQTLIRIACHELESWYLGDLQAVEHGLQIKGLAQQQHKRKYRTPDNLANAAQELVKITDRTYQKVAGSRAIGPHLSTISNLSHSFQVFVSGIQRLIDTPHSQR